MKNENDFGKFDFVGKAKFFSSISVLAVVLSLGYLAVRGITYGIDFSGGTEVQVKFDTDVSINDVRTLVNAQNLSNPGIQAFDETNEFVIRFQTPTGKTDEETNLLQNKAVEGLKTALTTQFADQGVDIQRVDSVGPQVGSELKRSGFLAIFYSMLLILIYVALRFDYKYSPGAVVCLVHDTIVTLAVFEMTGREINIPILAAILTLIGYSLNDTIVVFDRIRETEANASAKGMKFVINKAINDTLQRTLITSGTTLVSAFCLYYFTSGTVSDIAFAIFLGVLFGTYSSIFVASPMILLAEKLSFLKPKRV